MPKPAVPLAASGITPAWLNACLTSAMWPPVRSLRLDRLPGANPRITQVYRARLTFETAGSHPPPTLIVKIPAAEPAHRRHEAGNRVYEREINIYRTLAARQGTTLPRLSASVLNAAGLGAMLLEDLGPPLQAGAPFPADLIEPVVVFLAGMHSEYWESPDIASAKYVRGPANLDLWGDSPDAFPQRWTTLSRSRELPPRLQRTGDALASRLPAVLQQLEQRPRTLIHADLHPGNIMRRGPVGQPVIIDWQGAAFAGATSDIAKLMLHLEPDLLIDREVATLRQYHSLLSMKLSANGAPGYPYETFERDYRLAQAAILANYVMIAPAAKAQPGRPVAPNSLGASGPRVFAAIAATFPDDFNWP